MCYPRSKTTPPVHHPWENNLSRGEDGLAALGTAALRLLPSLSSKHPREGDLPVSRNITAKTNQQS